MSQALSLELLDGEHGTPIQTWEFTAESEIILGRSKDCSVVVGNPYVSRAHLCVQFVKENWELSATSQQGFLVNGRRQDHGYVTDLLEIRLGKQGPWFRFRTQNFDVEGGELATMQFESHEAALLILDPGRVDREVAAIADGEYFMRLKSLAETLRNPSQSASGFP